MVFNKTKAHKMVENISLIIPSRDAEERLLQLLSCIPNWKTIPNEIIIIDSSENKLSIPKDFESFTKNLNIQLLIIYETNLYPGHARNIGISNSKNSILAFLDTSTFPSNKWLYSGYNLMKNDNSVGVWGNTYYQAKAFPSKIFRACTFGCKPIKTFPGCILNKNIFNICGLFIESVRAGEDGDWMSRVDLQKIRMSSPEEFLTYNELNTISFKQLIKKWFRNYKHGAGLPFYKAHKNYYYYGISLVAVLVAFNWNRVIAAWDTESIFFIPNITTISAISIFTIYIILRGIILPKKKGVNIRFLFPINFVFIVILSALLDFTKALAFAYSKFDK
jgi:glycosyltransferase involved in cell wall biosynthesis